MFYGGDGSQVNAVAGFTVGSFLFFQGALMRIGISIKWTLSCVLIVILVVCVYAVFMIRDTQESVASETERIQRIQNEALDQLGAQTTKTVSLPASSLMFDNDLAGLSGLLAPIVSDKSAKEQSYSAIYATIVAPDGRVWVTVVSPEIDKLVMDGTTYYLRDGEADEARRVEDSFLATFRTAFKDADFLSEDAQRGVVVDGHEESMRVRQYAVPIRPKSSGDGDEAVGQAQGYLIVGYSIEGLEEEIATIRKQGEIRQSESMDRALWLAIFAVVVGLVIAGIQAFFVTRNIKKLSRVASQIASGDLSVRSSVKSRDEIGQLGDQFNTMADRVQALMLETEQKAMLEKEVDIARSIQTTLLPAGGYAECGPVSLYGFFQPASVCGGDFWSYNRLPDGSSLLTIGDVTGHGVPSAMITACAKSALDTLLNVSSAQSFDLSQIVSSLNAAICQTAKRTLFMTFQAIRVSADGRRAEMVNAGHNFPLIIRGGEVRGLVVRGERLGDNPKAQYETIRTDLQHGDMFLFYTDGLTEYLNESGVEYGEKRLRKVIAPFGQGDVTSAMQNLWRDFSEFCGNAPQGDDITLLFARIS